MYNKDDLNKALPMVALYKTMLHKQMLTCPIENLNEVRMHIDGLTKFENRLKNEYKAEFSDFLNELNK